MPTETAEPIEQTEAQPTPEASLNVADFEAEVARVKAGGATEPKVEEKADAKQPVEKAGEKPDGQPKTVDQLQAEVAGLKKELARRTDKKDEESTSLKDEIAKLASQVETLTKSQPGKTDFSDAELHDLLIYRKAELASAQKYGSEEEQAAAKDQIGKIEAEQSKRATVKGEADTKDKDALAKSATQFEGLYKQALTLHPDMSNKESAHWKACNTTYQRLHTENPELMAKLPEPWKELLAFSLTPVKGAKGETVLTDLQDKLEAGLTTGAKSVGGPTTPKNYSTMPPDKLEEVITRVKAGLPA